MPSSPLFSIVIPTYNRAAYIEMAVRSALNQMISGDELIVVDGGSQDETVEILKTFDDRILILHGAHGGAGRARNLGIEKARNELVVFLDSDDTGLPGKLQLQRVLMEARLVYFSVSPIVKWSAAMVRCNLDISISGIVTMQGGKKPLVPGQNILP